MTARRLAALVACLALAAQAAPPEFAQVRPGKALAFPQDMGAHPQFRTEWWYVTGWLDTPDHKPLGFQVTFFRSVTSVDADNPSRFAPKQLIVAHAALSDPALGHLLHAQKSGREGFDLNYARTGNTDVKLEGWRMQRDAQGRYHADIATADYTLHLDLQPTQPVLLEGEQGYSQKGAQAAQASYYYSEPQLQVAGTLTRAGKPQAVTGTAWLDHEWSSQVLSPDAMGWDWAGINLADGGALMAFRIRNARNDKIWGQASLRDASGHITRFAADQVEFIATRLWRSPHTRAEYPVAVSIRTGPMTWELAPLQDDQELDARASTGAVYWEGAVTVKRDGQNAGAGRGYLELTGYVDRLKL
ncbi:MAG TPA: carotenoid 1,2-hydratase [Burkholderiaceae bacterium]